MQSQTIPKKDDNRQPVDPNIAQLMDMLGTSQDVDLAWLVERNPAKQEQE